MLAKASCVEESPSFELLGTSHSLRLQAQHARLPEVVAPEGFGSHNDGSGIAWLGNDGKIRIEKRGRDDCWDESFESLVRSINTTALIAHNRKASPGLDVNMNVSHPYIIQHRGETIAFCHNGGISDFMEEARKRRISDSLVFLERLSQSVGSLTLHELKRALTESAETLQFSSISALLLTKESVFAWRCYQEVKDSSWNRDRYYSLYLKEGNGRVCIASEPLADDSSWSSISNRTLIQIRLGKASVETEQVAF